MDAVSAVQGIGSSLAAMSAPSRTAATDGSGFAGSMVQAIDDLRAAQSQSESLGVAAVTGDLDDIHSAMIASTRAAVTLELVAAVRNKGVDAFNEIMRMQA